MGDKQKKTQLWRPKTTLAQGGAHSRAHLSLWCGNNFGILDALDTVKIWTHPRR